MSSRQGEGGILRTLEAHPMLDWAFPDVATVLSCLVSVNGAQGS